MKRETLRTDIYFVNHDAVNDAWQLYKDHKARIRDAFTEGWVAYQDFGPEGANPHSSGTKRWMAWQDANEAARKPIQLQRVKEKKHEIIRREVEDALAGRFGDDRVQDYADKSIPEILEFLRVMTPSGNLDVLRAVYEMDERMCAAYNALRVER